MTISNLNRSQPCLNQIQFADAHVMNESWIVPGSVLLEHYDVLFVQSNSYILQLVWLCVSSPMSISVEASLLHLRAVKEIFR